MLAGKFISGFLTAWFLCSSLIAASDALHRSIHEDAGQSSHQCAITLIEQQQLLASDCATVVVETDLYFSEVLSPRKSVQLFATDCRLSPGRAPPASFLL